MHGPAQRNKHELIFFWPLSVRINYRNHSGSYWKERSWAISNPLWEAERPTLFLVLHNIFQKSAWYFKLLLGCLRNASKSSGKWGIYNPDEIPEVDEKRRSSPRQLNNPTLLHFEEKEKWNFAEQVSSFGKGTHPWFPCDNSDCMHWKWKLVCLCIIALATIIIWRLIFHHQSSGPGLLLVLLLFPQTTMQSWRMPKILLSLSNFLLRDQPSQKKSLVFF